MADLFTRAQLASYLQQPVDNSTADVVLLVASGWLKSATGLADFPTPIPDQLFAWGIELGAIAFRNPDGATSESIDDHSVSWDRQRRIDILNEARTAYSGAGLPLYSFPEWDWHWEVVPLPNPLTA